VQKSATPHHIIVHHREETGSLEKSPNTSNEQSSFEKIPEEKKSREKRKGRDDRNRGAGCRRETKERTGKAQKEGGVLHKEQKKGRKRRERISQKMRREGKKGDAQKGRIALRSWDAGRKHRSIMHLKKNLKEGGRAEPLNPGRRMFRLRSAGTGESLSALGGAGRNRKEIGLTAWQTDYQLGPSGDLGEK